MFFELLQLMVSHSVPLEDALPLAAEASGATDLVDAAHAVTLRLQRGESVAKAIDQTSALPPLTSCLFSASSPPHAIARSLGQLAQAYYRHAVNTASRFRVSFPVFATLLIGGVATGVYAILFLVPWVTFLGSLASLRF